MKVFVLDRRRPREFRVRQPGSGGLRLVSDVWDEAKLAGGGDMQQPETTEHVTPEGAASKQPRTAVRAALPAKRTPA